MMAISQPRRQTISHLVAHSGADALRSRLSSSPPVLPLSPGRSDYDLNPDLHRATAHELVPAAVLVPVVRRADPTVLFTRRTEHLARHAGQVSFPGGQLDPDDESLVAAALRETREETGIDPGLVDVAGFLDPYETGTGFAILPVIGVLEEGFSLVPNPREVAEIFEVPLAFFLEPANCERGTGEWQGRQRVFYAFRYKQHYIWGATASILVSFRDRFPP
ncbi:MAG TPA: CoA pyrophosphatase [Rhizomicrobium sp.]|nr:CoA pyrophosphatase [Rhizomicrobium sp.]